MHLSRRSFLSGVLGAGATGTLVGCGNTSPAWAGPSGGSAPVITVGPDELVPLRLFSNDLLNFATLLVLGGSAALTAEVGEVMRIVQTINAKTGNPQALTTAVLDVFYDQFGVFADHLAGAAQSQSSHPVTRRQRLQRASQYASAQLFFVLGTSRPEREEAIFDVCEQRFSQAAALYDPPGTPFSVSTRSGEVPGYFFRPADNHSSRPTVIISNGSDGQNIDITYAGLAAGLARGYNVATFEGPGQMSLLFKRQIPFTPNWDQVVGPVYDWVRSQPGVDKVGLIGISFAGMLCARAAAGVKGLNAVVLEPASHSYPQGWGDQATLKAVRAAQGLSAPEKRKVADEVNGGFQKEIPNLPPEAVFNIKKRGEIFVPSVMLEARAGQLPSDYFGLLESFLAYEFEQDYRRITIPTLLTDNQGDQFFASQAQAAFGMLEKVPTADKRLLPLTAAQGAQLHDQPLGPTVSQELIFDWLDQYLR